MLIAYLGPGTGLKIEALGHERRSTNTRPKSLEASLGARHGVCLSYVCCNHEECSDRIPWRLCVDVLVRVATLHYA